MRVTFIDQAGDVAGGAEQSLSLLLRYLPPEIHADIITFRDGPFADSLRERGHSVTNISLGAESETSTREHLRISALRELPISIMRIAELLKRSRADVVYTNTVKAHFFGSFAARLARKPAIAHLRDILPGLGGKVVRASIAFGSIRRIAISRSVAQAFALPKTTIIENPVDLSAYAALPTRDIARSALGIPNDGLPLVGIVGRINRWKGHDRFLQALAQVQRIRPVRGIIVGAAHFRDSDFLPELHTLVQKLQLQERVQFIDWVEDVRTVYAALDLHVNASDREPFGRTIIEAAAASVPSICFDDSGVAEFFEDNSHGIAVRAGDTQALADALIGLAQNTQRREALRSTVRTWANRFDARRHAERVAAIMNEVAQQ